jgi:hypothetical protein
MGQAVIPLDTILKKEAPPSMQTYKLAQRSTTSSLSSHGEFYTASNVSGEVDVIVRYDEAVDVDSDAETKASGYSSKRQPRTLAGSAGRMAPSGRSLSVDTVGSDHSLTAKSERSSRTSLSLKADEDPHAPIEQAPGPPADKSPTGLSQVGLNVQVDALGVSSLSSSTTLLHGDRQPADKTLVPDFGSVDGSSSGATVKSDVLHIFSASPGHHTVLSTSEVVSPSSSLLSLQPAAKPSAGSVATNQTTSTSNRGTTARLFASNLSHKLASLYQHVPGSLNVQQLGRSTTGGRQPPSVHGSHGGSSSGNEEADPNSQ